MKRSLMFAGLILLAPHFVVAEGTPGAEIFSQRLDMALDQIAPLPDGRGNAALYYCDFMSQFSSDHASTSFKGDRLAYDVDTTEFKTIFSGLKINASRFFQPEDYFPPIWIGAEEFRSSICGDHNLVSLIYAARGLVARGDELKSDRKRLQAYQCYRDSIVLGRHLFNEHSLLFLDKVGLVCMTIGVEAIQGMLEEGIETGVEFEKTLVACRTFFHLRSWYFDELDGFSAALSQIENSYDESIKKTAAAVLARYARHQYASFRIEAVVALGVMAFQGDIEEGICEVDTALEEALSESDERVRKAGFWVLGLQNTF